MEKTIQIINSLKEDNIIKDYAIGGAVASIFYIEPVTTYDLDIFVSLQNDDKFIITLEPIYEWFKERGYSFDKEHIIIEGIPVRFIPVYNELVKEAVTESINKNYGNTVTKVISPEYLITIMLQTNRSKDKERALRFIEEHEMDMEKLEMLLEKYDLKDKYNELKK